MKNLLAVLIAAFALVPDVAGGPSAALAWDRRHPHGGGDVVVVVPPKPFVRHGFPRGHVFPHPVGPVFPRPFCFHRPFAPFVVYPSPTYVYTPSPVYAPPQVVYVQPQPVVVSPPPIASSVIEYATGRYELRGDGVTTPYTWVWIPNPPPPPDPPEAPPAPSMEGAPDPAPSAEQAPSVPSELYHWVDDEGVRYWTDRLDKVPERYRPDARSRELPEVGS